VEGKGADREQLGHWMAGGRSPAATAWLPGI